MSDLADLRIWEDPAICGALSWYLDVAENRRPAKFRIAAKSDQVWLTDGLVKDRLGSKRGADRSIQKPALGPTEGQTGE